MELKLKIITGGKHPTVSVYTPDISAGTDPEQITDTELKR